MSCKKCNGRGFYQDSEVVDGSKHIIKCGCEPDKKYKRLYETLKRIHENWEEI